MMKLKKVLFPYMLAIAIVLTCGGVLTVNKSFAVDNSNQIDLTPLYIDGIYTKDVTILDNEDTTISYVIPLEETKEEYTLEFTIHNDSSLDMKLYSLLIDDVPEEIKEVLDFQISRSDFLDKKDVDHVIVKYIIKSNLTEEQKEILKKYNKVKVNMIFNYIQA